VGLIATRTVQRFALQPIDTCSGLLGSGTHQAHKCTGEFINGELSTCRQSADCSIPVARVAREFLHITGTLGYPTMQFSGRTGNVLSHFPQARFWITSSLPTILKVDGDNRVCED